MSTEQTVSNGSAPAIRVGIVGAGLGGAMAALYLAREGYEVEVFEARPDPSVYPVAETSMNLGLSRRGLEALSALGLAEAALAASVSMEGRVIHAPDGGQRFQPYGRRQGEVIHAIQRSAINALLIRAASAHPKVRFHYESRCVAVDRERAALLVRASTGDETERSFDFVVGADGIFSAVRQALQRGLRADYSQEFLSWGWKELSVPASELSARVLRRHAFHLWPRGGSMLFAHPNQDGSFTCSLVLPFEGGESFDALAGEGAVERYFSRTFPDLEPCIPDLATQFLSRPVIHLATVRTRPWHYQDRVVLVGDAAHAVVPFYAQGMNAAFEDCAALARCLGESPGDRRQAFGRYEAERKPQADALAEMFKENFGELRDRVRSPWLRLHKAVDLGLHRLFGQAWMPLHARVTNTTVPYAVARALDRRQSRILGWATALATLLLLGVIAAAVFRGV